jgi:effector-binding domain-containing protein
MLRHYDSLGLLPPSRVDPHTGYRFYEPALLARTVYRGQMTRISEAWQELFRHVTGAGLGFAGPCREVYLEMPDDPDARVTELQQPVK